MVMLKHIHDQALNKSEFGFPDRQKGVACSRQNPPLRENPSAKGLINPWVHKSEVITDHLDSKLQASSLWYRITSWFDTLRGITKGTKSSKTFYKGVEIENTYEKSLLGNVIAPGEIGVSFDDIGALGDVKDTLKELIMLPLQRPELFKRGRLTKPCKGILLFGPPGTGKTTLAKAVASEFGASFINISMSSITSMWYGQAEKYVKAIFTLASKISPTVIFIDEVDSLLRKRGTSYEHETTRKMKNEFMTNWDGLKTKDNEYVLVLAATNRPFDLDEAAIRRFLRRIMVNLPDKTNREKILRVILDKEELSPNFDYEAIAGMTNDYSGSDLKNLCVIAANRPIREILDREKEQKVKALAENLPPPPLLGSKDLRPLCVEDFRIASEQVRPSYSSHSSNMSQLIEWNELYGEGRSGKKTTSTLSYFI